MYKKGDIQISSDKWTSDARMDSGFERDVPDGVAMLPHSCDEWIIGGREQVEALIEDLQGVLDKLPEWTPEKLPERKRRMGVSISEMAPLMKSAMDEIVEESSRTDSKLMKLFGK
jgi:hypothetical protein